MQAHQHTSAGSSGTAAAAALTPDTSHAVRDGQHWGRWKFIAESGASSDPSDRSIRASGTLAYVEPTLQSVRHRISLKDCATSEQAWSCLFHVPEACRMGRDASDLLEAMKALEVIHGA